MYWGEPWNRTHSSPISHRCSFWTNWTTQFSSLTGKIASWIPTRQPATSMGIPSHSFAGCNSKTFWRQTLRYYRQLPRCPARPQRLGIATKKASLFMLKYWSVRLKIATPATYPWSESETSLRLIWPNNSANGIIRFIEPSLKAAPRSLPVYCPTQQSRLQMIGFALISVINAAT